MTYNRPEPRITLRDEFTLDDFSGSLNQAAPPDKVPPNDFLRFMNARVCDDAKSFERRPGTVKLYTFTKRVLGVYGINAPEETRLLACLEDDIQLEINQTMKAVEKEPERSSLRIKLGDLYMQKKRFKSAEEAYREAQKVDSTNTLVRAKLGDVKLVFMETRMDQFKEKLAANQADAAAAKELADLEKTYKAFRIKEFRQRVQDQPTNMEYHFALGRMLYEDSDMDGAMAMFQRTISDPRYRLVANHMLGRCLIAKEMYDRAVSTFNRALEGTSVMNETVKALYYDLGLTYEKMEDWKNAEHAYGKIYDSDIGYRDVAQKMDSVYKKARQQSQDSSS